MDIERLKRVKKEKKLSYEDLVNLTGYSRSTITNIFCGYTKYPRHETVAAIEKALGITSEQYTQEPEQNKEEDIVISDERKQLIDRISEYSPEELKGIILFLDYIDSKRK